MILGRGLWSIPTGTSLLDCITVPEITALRAIHTLFPRRQLHLVLAPWAFSSIVPTTILRINHLKVAQTLCLRGVPTSRQRQADPGWQTLPHLKARRETNLEGQERIGRNPLNSHLKSSSMISDLFGRKNSSFSKFQGLKHTNTSNHHRHLLKISSSRCQKRNHRQGGLTIEGVEIASMHDNLRHQGSRLPSSGLNLYYKAPETQINKRGKCRNWTQRIITPWRTIFCASLRKADCSISHNLQPI